MAAADFADLIISKLSDAIGTSGSDYTKDTPEKANKAIAEAVTEYILDNTKILVAYSGVNSAGVADPLVADTCPVDGECAPPKGTDFSTWIKSLESNIVAGFKIDAGEKGVKPVAPPPAFLPGIVPDLGALKKAHTDNIPKPPEEEEGDKGGGKTDATTLNEGSEGDEEEAPNPQKPVWTEICKWIIDWLSKTVAAPFAAENPNASSKGMATPSKTDIT